MKQCENKIIYHLISGIIYFILGISFICIAIPQYNTDWYRSSGYEFMNFIGFILIINVVVKVIRIINLNKRIKAYKNSKV